MNPYETLGIDQDATDDEITKAYREKAKESHPDTGGSSEQFAVIKHAKDILSDAERRKKYDETGATDETRPDNELSAVHSEIANAFNTVLQSCDAMRQDPASVDFVMNMTAVLEQRLSTMLQDRITTERHKARFIGLQRRFHTKVQTNFISDMIRSNIAQFDSQLNRIKIGIETTEKALEMLDDYSFEMDETSEQSPQFAKSFQWTQFK